MDFYRISTREIERGPHKGELEIFPDFTVGRSKDLMVRGRSFYAIWDEERGLWSTDEYDVQRLVDADLRRYAEKMKEDTGTMPLVKYLQSFGSHGWSQFRKFLQNISDNSHDLDSSLTFADAEPKKTDYASRRLPYSLEPGDISAWNEIVGTLYNTEQRGKIEWAIGAIVAGDSKKIQKFIVLYGAPETGKGTIINILLKLFVGYTTTFEAKALGSSNGTFATEVFKGNPLVAIQHDGDLSKIDDNARLNSIISHEEMTMNEKFKPSYTAKVHAFLFLGTNQPVKISDAKSGIIRRLIDTHPTGVKIPTNHYHTLMGQIDFELGAIAHHCLEVYREMGKNYYNGYRPLEMMLQTDIFFNFIEANFDLFKEWNHVSLQKAYAMYKEFCGETGIERVLPQYKVREELRNYFDEFKDRHTLEDGKVVRSYYIGFTASKFKTQSKKDTTFSLVIDETVSLLDEMLADQPAQTFRVDEYGDQIPANKWSHVQTTLKDLDTSELHFVQIPQQHIVIDFDLKDEKGDKSLERNLEAASVWPATYAELSKGGGGVHLHYIYDGDVTLLSSVFSEGIEVKTLLGNASLRRRLTKCNNIPVAVLKNSLPLKEKKSMLKDHTIKSEKALRDMINRNLRKEIHAGTKSSVDFIAKILEDAYESGMPYDVNDMRGRIVAFANNSTNQPLKSLETVMHMRFQGKPVDSDGDSVFPAQKFAGDSFFKPETPREGRIAFFDVEVYPNLFVVCWKYEGDVKTVRMINPSSDAMAGLFKMKLVGFYNRRYDNHIIYARYLGYNNQQLFELSQKLIAGTPGAMFGEAYNLSYADIYDFTSKKQSLKKYEIDLGIHHMELDLPWDEPVPDIMVEKVVDYCVNDVEATEVTFDARRQDFVARQILADLSGLTVNDTTQKHTAKIIFGNDRNPQQSFKYTDLSKEFPGYTFDPTAPLASGKSKYRDEDPGEGGYVYAEPGIYENVALLDVASMHPTSIVKLNLFGDEYTPNFEALLLARLAIKHKKYDEAKTMLNGALAPYLKDEADAEALSYALKIVINIVYGLTSAKFDNPFRDRRNKDNIVAKRGALFMINLKHFVQEQGFTVAHIKTDSIKIPNATAHIIHAVQQFGEKYGYTLEHEATYDKMALVNEAVYVAKYGWAEKEHKIGTWEAVGAQFQHPYVFKTLFTGEPVVFEDVCETKQVSKGVMYLDFDCEVKPEFVAGKFYHVGRTGRFVPVKENSGGGILYRVSEGKLYAVTGTKGYFWKEAEQLLFIGEELAMKQEIDFDYFDKLVDAAKKTINKFGPFEEFIT